ncbi:hypothetical protein [Streptomyces sp. NPDC058066]
MTLINDGAVALGQVGSRLLELQWRHAVELLQRMLSEVAAKTW